MKILCLEKDVTDIDTILKGTTLATQECATIGLPLEFIFQNTTNNFTSVKTSKDNPNQVDGYAVDSTEVFQTAKSFNIDFNLALLIYDWTKITPQPTNPSDGGLAISIPTEWYQTFPEVLAEYILHELCHALFSASTQPDTTHAYPPNFGQKPRSDYYLYLILSLKPYWGALTTPTTPTTPFKPDIVITRQPSDFLQTLGILRKTDGQFGCDTLELPWLQNKQNISCIPTGNYKVKKVFSLKFGNVYEVQDVPGRSGIYFHEGNFFFNTKGCILLGSLPKDINSDGQIDLQNSKLIRQAFQNYMGWKTFNLQII